MAIGAAIASGHLSRAENTPVVASPRLGLAGVIASALAKADPLPSWRKVREEASSHFPGISFEQPIDSTNFRFRAIDEAEAFRLQVDSNERQAFNSELERLNQLRDDVIRETILEMSTGRILSPSEVTAFARERWNTHCASLSTPARSAVQKIAENLTRKSR